MKKCLVLVVMVFLLGACSDVDSSKRIVSETGSVLFVQDGVKIKSGFNDDLSEDDKVLDFYFEVNSAAAALVYQNIAQEVIAQTRAGVIKTRLHPLVYLNNQGNSYLFAKVFASLSVLEPDFVGEYLSVNLVPETMDLSEKSLAALMKSWDFTDERIAEIFKEADSYHKQVVKGTESFVARGQVTMPYITLTQGAIETVVMIEDVSQVSEQLRELIAFDKETVVH